jgi:hypothetical protein
MSEFWEMYKKRVAEGSNKLSKPPKDVDQNILWLKAYVSERMENEGLAKYVGDTKVEGTFGFAESYVNYLMHYAYEAGEKAREDSYNRSTEEMRKSLDKIKDALDDVGWIGYRDDY